MFYAMKVKTLDGIDILLLHNGGQTTIQVVNIELFAFRQISHTGLLTRNVWIVDICALKE